MRMGAIKISRSEMETITAKIIIKAALRARLPPDTRFDLKPGQSV